MRKSLILFIFFLVQIVTSYAQAVIINDNNHLVKENELYLITVDFLWKIKNAHYIGGHINIADTLVYIKILAPKEKRDKKSNEKIKIGNSYEMTLFRYYPYELCHEIDRYQYIRCLPPYKLKDKFHWCEIAAKEFNLPDKLFFMVTHLASFSEFSAFEISSYVTIMSIDSVYDNGKYMTYRILWVSSLDPYEFCTYFSFKKDKESRKLVGISTL